MSTAFLEKFKLSADKGSQFERVYACKFLVHDILNVPTAINSNFLGLTIFTTLSVYLNIASIISSSVDGGGRSSGCEQGWTMPFISRYLQVI